MHGYNKLYLESVMNTLGAMLDYAVWGRRVEVMSFYERFLASGIDKEIEHGNPRFIAGLSGSELAERVLEKTGSVSDLIINHLIGFGPEYWAGWALALLQWETGYSFRYIHENGMDLATVLNLYSTLHEADPQKFVDVAKVRIELFRKENPSRLKVLRKAMGLTQEQLAERAGVSLRAIQAYEQRYLDISRAEAQSLRKLALVLGCDMEDLLG